MICCLRCTAHSKRSGLQCGRPASKGSKTQKCHVHGGRGNSGAKTPEGKLRAAKANLKSGLYTQAAKLEHSKMSAKLSQLEDALYVLGMSEQPRIRGRKSALYSPITSVEDVRQMMLDALLHNARGSSEG
jgi:ubiquitin